ncbi:MAG: hypothetical protein J5521_04840, partial [Lachnospiraceae bacterium]|nr:hypothetical protein [Lachnospiraceae bacterium]
LTTVVFGRSTRYLGYEIFGGCKTLSTIVVPESVTEINDGIFSRYYGDNNAITIVCKKGSFADEWAQSLNLHVEYNIEDYYD